MQEKFYALTDSEWEVIKEIVDNQRKIKHEKRVIANAILWILTTGSQWRNMESKYPPWQNRSSLKAEWKTNRKGMLEKMAIGALAVTVAVVVLSRKNRRKGL